MIDPSKEVVTQSLLELLTKAVQNNNKVFFFGLLKAVSEERVWMLAKAIEYRMSHGR